MRFSSAALVVLLSASQPVLGATYASQVGSYVASTVKATIQADVSAVLKAFSGKLPNNVLNIVQTALNLTVLQNLSGTTTATELDTLSNMVSNKLADVENTVFQGITNGSYYLGTQNGANYTDLRNCIADVVAHAGTASGQTCLTMNNTAAISDIKEIFRNMVDQFEFQMPMQTVLQMQSEVDAYLSNSSLIPAAADLVQDVQKAMLSVAATTKADYRDAVYSAEACFFEALAQPVYTKAYEYECNMGDLNDTDSTLDNVQDIFRATVNQYAGVLPPEIVENIQEIGDHYLPANISKADNATRNDVNNAIKSVVASKSGNSATLVYQLLDCLDLVMVPNAGNITTQQACLNSPTGVAASRLNIVNGYIEQFYGVLPPKLILDMKDKVLPTIQNDTSKDAKATRKKLDALFTASGAGPAYVTCYQKFEGCVVNALGNATASAQCQLGADCKTVPFQTAQINTTSPYAAAVAALDKAQRAGKPKPVQRAAVFAAAGEAAKKQSQSIYFSMPKAVRKQRTRKLAPPKKLKKSGSTKKKSNTGSVAPKVNKPNAGGKKSSGSTRKPTTKGKTTAKGHKAYKKKQAKHHGSQFSYAKKHKAAVSKPKLIQSSCTL